MKNVTSRIVISTVCEEPYDIATNQPELLYDFWNNVIASRPDHDKDKESLVVVLLNTKLKPQAWNLVSLGTISETLAHPREILRPVITHNSYAFALMHNHPSGDPTPSKADVSLTSRVREAAELMQIRFIDHVIVGAPAKGRASYHSFRESGHL